MLVERTFWPVGHGGFFSERIFWDKPHSCVTVVYDCGTLRHRTLCHERIDAFLHPRRFYKFIDYTQHISNKNTRLHFPPYDIWHPRYTDYSSIECIDILFITHFDDDHINCIAHLAKHVDIKNVIIPYFDDYDLLYLHAEKGSLLPNSTADIQAALGLPRSTNIYRILPETGLDDSVNNYTSNDPRWVELGEVNNSDTTIHSRTQLYLPNSPDWFWAVFNYDRPHNTPRIRKEIRALLIAEGADPDDLNYLINRLDNRDIKKKINTIYGSSADKNNGSLVIFSGANYASHVPIYLSNPLSHNYLHIHYIGGCGFSYMGDYDSKSRARLDAYLDFISPYKKQLSGIQVPHHGSSHNFSPEILKGIQWSIAAVPNENTKHPNTTVWTQMNLHGFAFCIDESNDSLLMQYFKV